MHPGHLLRRPKNNANSWQKKSAENLMIRCCLPTRGQRRCREGKGGWVSRLPFVDEKRIAFYGISYGGEAAMRVPAVLDGYCLSICSADFGDWTRKVVDTHFEGGFMNSIEWEMPYFNMGSTFSYAEMA